MHALSVRFGKALRSGGHGASLNFNSIIRACVSSKAALDHDRRRLDLVTTDGSGQSASFPFPWLRDNCQCEKCFEPKSFSRVVNLREWSLDMKPKSVTMEDSDNRCVVHWEDGHVSPFDCDWLLEHSFGEQARGEYRRRQGLEPQPWGEGFNEEFPRAKFDMLMEDDRYLLNSLLELNRFGFVLVEGAGDKEDSLERMQDRIAFQKKTHYGPTFQVEVSPNPDDVAVTSKRVGLHTDLACYDFMPGGIFLHCVKQHGAEGGESIFSDGLKAADLLRRRNPEAYRILSETVVAFRDVGPHYDKVNRSTFLVLDHRGRLARVNWSHFARDSVLDLPVEKVEPLYRAMRAYDDLVNGDECRILYKLRPGDIACVVNTRVMHGRTSLEGEEVSCRRLRCGYMDWDEISSKIRVLKKELAL